MARRVFLFTIILFAVLHAVYAQSDSPIFAPFIAHLQAESNGTRVKLTWTDSASVRGPLFVYRSDRPFEGGFRNENMCAEVYYGRQTYTETVPAEGLWYYCVIASFEGRRYEMVVPYNNMLEIEIDGGSRVVSASGAVGAPQGGAVARQGGRDDIWNEAAGTQYVFTSRPPEQQSSLPVTPNMLTLTALAATPEPGGIRITFVSANRTKSPVVYRNIAPIMRVADLLTSDIAQLPGAASPFFDRVQTGIPYYYAVVYDEDIRSGQAFIAPGYNSTIYPATVTIAVSAARQDPVRYIPPAYETVSPVTDSQISLESTFSDYTVSPLSEEARAAISSNTFTMPVPYQAPVFSAPPIQAYVKEDAPVAELEPRIFQSDLAGISQNTEEARLQSIIKESFTWRKWPEAISALSALLSSVKDTNVETRARYYLGQAYYFTGLYNNTMTEMLAVQAKLPGETSLWIQLSLNALTNHRNNR